MRFFLFLIFSLVITSAACAQEANDDWGDVMKDYSSNRFDKIISPAEYKKALETKESFIKKPKKNQKNLGTATETKPEEKPMFEVPNSPYPLLVLPEDVYYQNITITQGFYLVNLKCDGGKYFLELNQGRNLPVVIEAKGHIAPGKIILAPQVSVENVDDKMVKINYSADNLILESTLWKY